MISTKDAALLAAKTLSEKLAKDIVVIDIAEKAAFADYFVIASASSERQLGNLADYVDEAFGKAGVQVKSIEGKPNSGWVLIDACDVIVNIFTADMRSRYNIEKVWGDCNMIDYEEGNR